jgi:hypothetical protein
MPWWLVEPALEAYGPERSKAVRDADANFVPLSSLRDLLRMIS